MRIALKKEHLYSLLVMRWSLFDLRPKMSDKPLGAVLRGSPPVRPKGDQHPPPLTFGLGRYHCLGAMLARLEIASLLEAIQPIVPKLRLSGPVQWRESWLLHEARSLPVELHGVSDAD